jgi:predicted nucleic acid binding AN1-type Zn finger protein
MKTCKNCGNLNGIPIICSYCGKEFCEGCRLPETHNCDNFNSRIAIPLWKKLQ